MRDISSRMSRMSCYLASVVPVRARVAGNITVGRDVDDDVDVDCDGVDGDGDGDVDVDADSDIDALRHSRRGEDCDKASAVGGGVKVSIVGVLYEMYCCGGVSMTPRVCISLSVFGVMQCVLSRCKYENSHM